MTLTLKRIIWDDGRPSIDPEDYQVTQDGNAIGRIYRRDRYRVEGSWNWSIYGVGGWLADSLEDAKAQFKAAWAERACPSRFS